MHHIQNSILDQLMTHKVRRYSELRPPRVESNLFQYHLKHLIKEKYIQKVVGGYSLSIHGLYYADRHSNALRVERPQPKLISIIVLTNSQGQVLVQPKRKQPFIDTYHLPAGKLHEGESSHAAAMRELSEKTGITSCDLSYRSTVHCTVVENESMISEYYGFIFTGVYDGDAEDGVWIDPLTPHVPLAPTVSEVLSVRSADAATLQEWTVAVTI